MSLFEEIIKDNAFTQEERQVIRKFSQAAIQMAAVSNVTNFDVWNIHNVSHAAGVELNFPKEGLVMISLWCVFYACTKQYYPSSHLKYHNVSSFLSVNAYRNRFGNMELWEQEQLKDEANWMNVLFVLLPARKNKGLAIQVIPKMIEGWYVKYVTGSGQTKSTADRVFLFETEGNVTPCHRGGRIALLQKAHAPPVQARKKHGIMKKPTLTKYRSNSLTSDSEYTTGRSYRPNHRHVQSCPSSPTNSNRVTTRRSSFMMETDEQNKHLSLYSLSGKDTTDTPTFAFPGLYEFPDTDAEFDDVSVISDQYLSGSPRGSQSLRAGSTSTSNDTQSSAAHPGLILPSPLQKKGVNVGCLGGLSFQPLFDFLHGAAASGVHSNGGPMLKRAYSWESQFVGEETPLITSNPFSLNDMTETGGMMNVVQVSSQEKHLQNGGVNGNITTTSTSSSSTNFKANILPVQDFLFDAYLSTTNDHMITSP